MIAVLSATEVIVVLRPRPDIASVCQVGSLVEVVSLQGDMQDPAVE